MENKTSICVERQTLDRLKKLKLAKRESYDEIINRLINDSEQQK